MTRQVLLLHGFTHTGGSWEPVVGALGERYRALAPDIRGHGSASDRRPVDLAGVLRDIRERAEERFILVGYSMGGRLALHLALDRPEGVERLVLISASPGIAEDGAREARRQADERLAQSIERSGIGEFAHSWAQTPVLAGLPEAAAERAHRDRLRNTPGGLAAALRGLGTGALPPVWERLGELRMPVALVVGERDHKFQDVARRMAPLLPRARVIVVPAAGHAVHLEAPGRIAQVIAGSGA